jgi:U3 small nucleolar RNA-associated protein 20
MARNKLSLQHLRAKPAPKRRTETTKKHRFETFTQRISRLKIDPVRRPRGLVQDEEQTTRTFSFFKSSLDRWIDSNLSDQFTKFVKDVELLSESLPQILHHENEISDLLLNAIENGTSVSLEPLLDLISQLAHDLGPRFEAHFARSVSVVTHVASTNPDVAVIEWSFNCLAWLFKYLSKLLVPDLRPLYDMMAPLLGKSRQKMFVSRFAAEAFGYLVRKAGMIYHKDKEPLSRIIRHVMNDVSLAQPSTKENYAGAASIMFAEAMKGATGALSASGVPIFLEMLKYSTELGREGTESGHLSSEIARTVLQTVQACCSCTEIQPVVICLVEQVELFNKTTSPAEIAEAMKMLVSVVGFKNGTTIEDWKRLLGAIASTVLLLSASEDHFEVAPLVLACFAVAHQYAPVDCAIGQLSLLNVICAEPWSEYFLGFCELYADLSAARFQQFVLTTFQRSVERSICDLLTCLDSSPLHGAITATRYVFYYHGSSRMVSW